MQRMLGGQYRWGVANVFMLRAQQGDRLNHEQRLCLKNDGRPCPSIKYKGRTSSSVYSSYLWICGGENDEGTSTYFCWPCLVMGEPSRVRKLYKFIIFCI